MFGQKLCHATIKSVFLYCVWLEPHRVEGSVYSG